MDIKISVVEPKIASSLLDPSAVTLLREELLSAACRKVKSIDSLMQELI